MKCRVTKMQLRELKYNVFFEYIKDIRRYSYEVEDFLRSEKLCDTISPIIPFPDEIEPLAERVGLVKELEDKTFIFNISQISLSVVVRYKNDSFIEDKVKNIPYTINKIKIGVNFNRLSFNIQIFPRTSFQAYFCLLKFNI